MSACIGRATVAAAPEAGAGAPSRGSAADGAGRTLSRNRVAVAAAHVRRLRSNDAATCSACHRLVPRRQRPHFRRPQRACTERRSVHAHTELRAVSESCIQCPFVRDCEGVAAPHLQPERGERGVSHGSGGHLGELKAARHILPASTE
eukprot:111758-Chlamydomonas_euryale.AAC.16